jgi:apolipoprotein N-acyltransferase
MPVRKRKEVQKVPWPRRVAPRRKSLGRARPGLRSERALGAGPSGVPRPDQPVRKAQVLAVLLSAGCFVLAFPEPDLGFLAWVALVPLFFAARRRSARAAFSLGFLWGIAAYGGVLWWITTFGTVVWAGTAMLAAIFPALALLAINWVEHDHGGPWLFLWIAVVWTAVEFLRSQGPLGFPWALLGTSQYRATSIIQIASITGIYGVTFLVALVNGTLYALLTRRAVLVPMCGAGLALAGTMLWGTAQIRQPVPATFIAAAVQPNFPTRPGVGSPTEDRDLADLRALTHEAASRGAALIVWPETASPADILGASGVLRAIRSWAQGDGVSVIATSLEHGRTNSAFSVASSGALTGRYDKMRLVPFAEAGEQPGPAPTLLPTPQARIGVAICFESTFPEVARRSVRQGANLLAVITNDAWFDGSTAPTQHAALAPFRAIEEGRYLVRAANQGISAIIDPRGRPLGELPLRERGVLTARVAPLGGLTAYARIGDTFGWGVTLLAAGLVVPRALAFVAEEVLAPAFARLIANSAVPLLVIAGVEWLHGPAPAAMGTFDLPVSLVGLLAVTTLLSLGRSRQELGFRIRSFVPAAILGLAFVGALALVARHAFATHGAVLDLAPPRGGWWKGTAVQVLVVGLALEWWLRGLVFADALAWHGWKTAVLWSALLGAIAASVRGAEAMVWALCGGAALGLIRARWAQVPALAVVHGVGNILLGSLVSLW